MKKNFCPFGSVPACAAVLGLSSGIAIADDGLVYYGSSAGMHLTTISKEGIGTANAVIRVKHTPKDARAFCVEYSHDNSTACVKRTMLDVKIGDRVIANCVKKTWTDVYGKKFAFMGPNKNTDVMVEYAVRDIKTGELLDGSTASGYDVALTSFKLLCPGIAK